MSASVLPANQEDREVYLREHDAGQFIEALQRVQTTKGPFITTVAAFHAEPELLYVAVDYASTCGVAVTLAPMTDQADERSS